MAIVVAEGIWMRPGQPAVKIFFCMKNGMSGVIFADNLETDLAPHGYAEFRELPGDPRPFLCLGFHHSNENCKELKNKMLFAEGGGVWRDYYRHESFVMTGVGQLPHSLVGLDAATLNPMLNTETLINICNLGTVEMSVT